MLPRKGGLGGEPRRSEVVPPGAWVISALDPAGELIGSCKLDVKPETTHVIRLGHTVGHTEPHTEPDTQPPSSDQEVPGPPKQPSHEP